MKNTDRPVKITVCADGFVSVMRTPKDRRLGAALTCYSTDSIQSALMLIRSVCFPRMCEHGGKTGTTVEMWAPNFPLCGTQDTSHIEELNELFFKMENSKAWPVIRERTLLEIASHEPRGSK